MTIEPISASDLHEIAEAIVDEGVVEDHARRLGAAEDHGDQRRAEQGDGQFGHRTVALLAAKGADQDQDDRADRQDGFRQRMGDFKTKRIHGTALNAA